MSAWLVGQQDDGGVAVRMPWRIREDLADVVEAHAVHFTPEGKPEEHAVELTVACGMNLTDEDEPPQEGFTALSLDPTAAAALGAFLVRWAAEHGA